MKKQVVDRLFQNAVAMVVVLGAYVEPEWALYKLVHSNGLPAGVCMLALFMASVVAFLDTLVNDMLPPKYTLQVALGKRRGMWMFLAVTYAGIAFVAIRSGFGLFSAIYFLLFAARCAGVAFLDLYYQYEDVVKSPTTAINPTLPGVLGDA